MITFSSEDLLQKYLASQSKLSTCIQNSKNKILNTKNEFKSNLKSKGSTGKLTKLSNKESGSEYFPSTDSGKINSANILLIYSGILLNNEYYF